MPTSEVAAGRPQAEVPRQFRVFRATVAKWVRRRGAEGERGLEDCTSAPRHHPRQTSPAVAARSAHHGAIRVRATPLRLGARRRSFD